MFWKSASANSTPNGVQKVNFLLFVMGKEAMTDRICLGTYASRWTNKVHVADFHDTETLSRIHCFRNVGACCIKLHTFAVRPLKTVVSVRKMAIRAKSISLQLGLCSNAISRN
jgi:hypothetical protein